MKLRLFILLILLANVTYAQERKTQNIVFISVDGYRWQEMFRGLDTAIVKENKFVRQDSAFIQQKYGGATVAERREKLMPFFWRVIAKEGQLYGNRDVGSKFDQRNNFWFSYPGRSETICGYFDPKINSNSYPNNPNENVLEFINKQAGFQNKVVTFAGWDAVAQIVNRDRNKMPLYNPNEQVKGDNLTEAQQLANEIQAFIPQYYGTGIRWDFATYAMAKSYMKANRPRFTYIDFADLDCLGHDGQYDYYLDAARYLDDMVRGLWEMIQADSFYKDKTTLVIVPDHGRGVGDLWKDHGQSAPGAGETWMAVLGPDTPALGEMKQGQVYQDQVAQTMARLLGFEFTANHPVGPYISTVFN